MRELVQQQENDIEQAFVMNTGPYRVHPSYMNLIKTPAQWTKLGKSAREKHLKYVYNAPLKPACVKQVSTDVTPEHTCTDSETQAKESEI